MYEFGVAFSDIMFFMI